MNYALSEDAVKFLCSNGGKIDYEAIDGEVTPEDILPKATKSSLGGVIVGDGLDVDLDGTLSLGHIGGRLIACGIAYNTASNSSSIEKNTVFNFSSGYIPSKVFNYENYVDDILFVTGTTYPKFSVNLKGIVGMVEVTVSYTGHCGSGMTGIWFQGNAEDVPDGVTYPTQYVKVLLGTPTNAYGGNSHTYIFMVGESTAEDAVLQINPSAFPYGGAFMPCAGGTACSLTVKVYSRY